MINTLLRWNFEQVQGDEQSEFYFDPHTKEYTGKQAILKGWCSGTRGGEKIMNADFVHTRKGQPVYFENTDNYEDIRERFKKLQERFRTCFGMAEDRELTWIIDRGIFSHELFHWIIESRKNHLITWEKGYQKDGWVDERHFTSSPPQTPYVSLSTHTAPDNPIRNASRHCDDA